MSKPTADITVLSSRLGAAHDVLARWHRHELRQQTRLEVVKMETGAKRVTVEIDPLVAKQQFREAYLASFYYDEAERIEVRDESDSFATPNFNAELRVLAAEIANQHRRCLERGFGDREANINGAAHWQFVGRRISTVSHAEAVKMIAQAAQFSKAVIDANRKANRQRKAA